MAILVAGKAGRCTAAMMVAAALAGAAEPTPIDPPAAPGAGAPAIAAEPPTAVSRVHEVLMTWLEPDGDAHRRSGRLVFARRSDAGWGQPITIARGVSELEPADRPSLTVIDTQAVRRTLIARTGDVVARSGDAGRTWSRLPAPALPAASFAGADEGAYAFWIAAGDGGGEGAAKLLGTRVLAGETLLDARVAAGWGTSATMTWDGPVVAYRDEIGGGAQEIALIRRQDARWTSPVPIHAEGRQPAAGKPQGGPRVAALRRRLAVAWYSEAAGQPRLLVAFSDDAGRTFAPPVEVDRKVGARAPAGAVDLALDGDGQALVLWTATAAGPLGADLELARVSPDGRRGEPLVLARGLPERAADMPQIVRAGERVAVVWVEGAPARLRAVAVPLDAVPATGGRPARAAGAPPPTVAAAEKPGRGGVGDSVPDLALTALDGGEAVSLAALRGRPVLLNLWATWCLPCIAEMPELAALHRRHGGGGLAVVGVSVDDAGAGDAVRAFVAEHGIPFAVWLDPEMRLYRALGVRGLPATFVIDREGRIVVRRDRKIAADDPELLAALDRALSDSAP